MSEKLETIVPDLKLCKQIPAGKFAESVLVWFRDDAAEKFFAWEREQALEAGMWHEDNQMVSAPTLSEIEPLLQEHAMNAVRHTYVIFDPVSKLWNAVYMDLMDDVVEHRFVAPKGANAALKLWLRLNEIEVK